MSFEKPAADDFAGELAVHKDLFETISEAHYLPELGEAHYLPELGGPHDEALLESLVEKGCEDNQILGQTLDKLAHLVAGADYAEEEEDILLGGAPVADIIDRLEQSLESPGRSSMSAAQGLLHLHAIGERLPDAASDGSYMSDEVFAEEPPSAPLNAEQEMQSGEVNQCEIAEKRLESTVESTDAMYTDMTVPETHDSYAKKTFEEQPPPSLPDQSEMAPSEPPRNDNNTEISEQVMLPPIDDQVELCSANKQEPTTEDITMEIAEELLIPKLEEVATDLSLNNAENTLNSLDLPTGTENTSTMEDNLSDKCDEQPKDLTVHRRLPTPHASPRRIDIPRAPSRESDAMQSPQPSGIPAVPSSPEIFTMPVAKSKQALFLESLLSSPSPKMYTSEVTITKQQCEPLNLGKHRKSASPTVSSCSDEIRKLNKDYGEPQEKKIRHESADAKIDTKKVPEVPVHKSSDETSPLKQLHVLKMSPDFNIPDPLLVPKDKLAHIIDAPGREIPALLIQRPELRLPEAFAFPAVLQDPDILVISLSQLENIIENNSKKLQSSKTKEHRPHSSNRDKEQMSSRDKTTTPQPDQTSQVKAVPSMDALAGDIDAATSAALNQMLWLPYLSQLEAMAACSQNMDFLKALNSSGYSNANYPDISQMFNPTAAARLMNPSGFPMVPQMDYDSRLQFAMWQEAMNHANASASQRQKQASSLEAQMKELASKTSDVQNPYVHSTKNHQSTMNKSHSSARTSPIAHNYNTSQRSMAHNPFLQGMYPGMNPTMRPNMALPGLQIPYFNPNLMGSQRSPRTPQQKSPTSPYYPNNNYLHSVKQPETPHQRSSSASSQESPRPRISVKSLQNLLEPSASGSSKRASVPTTSRRRDEPEVGSTTPLGEPPPPHLPPHPHDPAAYHLWHPLFGNQKGYNSPWSWTTVTATGD